MNMFELTVHVFLD